MKTLLSVLVLSLLAGTASAVVELTPENFDEMTAGKSVFIKFFAPWCGHCMALKPAWDQLAEAFEDSKTQLIADVDCTAEGQPLCEAHGVQGYPTIKYGDPLELEDYQGQRDFETLKAFADEHLKPQCSPANLDLCDDEKKAEIEKYQSMGQDALATAIAQKEEELAKLDEEFDKFLQGLQKSYEEMMEKNDMEKEAIKKSGLSLMKAVRASMAPKNVKDEL